MADTKRGARALRILTLLAVGVFAAYRLAELTTYAFWYDELFSLGVAEQGWSALLTAAVADRTNPPLFYALLKLWIGIGGESMAWLRLLPCLLGIAVALPLSALARRLFANTDAGLPATAATLAVAAASPLLVALSNELRGYSLLLLLTVGSLLAFLRLAESADWLAGDAHAGEVPSWRGQAAAEHQRRAVLLAIANILLVYTHYFGWLVVAAECGAALFWYRPALRAMIAGGGATAAAFAPWAIAVARQDAGVAARPLSNVDWISRPVPGDIPTFYDALVARVLTPGTAWVGGVVLVVPLLVLAVRTFGTRQHVDRQRAAVLAWFAALPVLAVFAFSVVGPRSVFVPRYLIVAAPAWWLLIGLSAATVGRSRLASLAPATVISLFTLTAGVAREMRGGEKIAWNAVIAAIAADAGSAGGAIYSLEGFTALPAAYYAATSTAPLTVRPVREFSEITAPAWIVVRESSRGAPVSIGSGLAPAGISLVPIHTARIPSHSITAYRVTKR